VAKSIEGSENQWCRAEATGDQGGFAASFQKADEASGHKQPNVGPKHDIEVRHETGCMAMRL
jgi:hypothetical protein